MKKYSLEKINALTEKLTKIQDAKRKYKEAIDNIVFTDEERKMVAGIRRASKKLGLS